MFKPNALYYVDGYKIGHKAMLAPGTLRLGGTEIPRSLKYGPKGATKIVNFGKQLVWRWIHDQFEENFFKKNKNEATKFAKKMSKYLMMNYDGAHFEGLHNLGYLPIEVFSLPEYAEVYPNTTTSFFINTIDGFAWLTLWLETIASSLSWKPMLAATIAKQYRKNCTEWVMKTDPDNAWLIDYMCHDFSSRGLDPHNMVSVGLAHATSFRGSDTLMAIPASEYYYNQPEDEVVINSVNASEHSVTCTGIFYYKDILESEEGKPYIKEYYSFDVPSEGSIDNPDYLAIAEWMNLKRWIGIFPDGILSVVSDTFDLWKLITFILPRLKTEILARNGKLVIRPDSGDPVDIICGLNYGYPFISYKDGIMEYYTPDSRYLSDKEKISESEVKGVIELLWDTFGGTINKQGYKVLDSHIGAIYGDSITIERQVQIYERLAQKGFASTNIVLGVGSFTYQYNTRDSIGLAYKGAWFETELASFDIYKDPITDDGTKKSLKGFQFVYKDDKDDYINVSQVSEEKFRSEENELKLIYKNGEFFNQIDFETIRKKLLSCV